MKISCNQFEGLISFYLNNDLSKSLKDSFEEHLKECSSCRLKLKVLNSIVDEIKEAYDKFINRDNYTPEDVIDCQDSDNIDEDNLPDTELSAYIDNELNDESSIQVRKDILTKPKIRRKLEKLYDLRRLIVNSFIEQKNSLKTDYSKIIAKSVNTGLSDKEIYLHCALFFITIVAAIVISVWAILNII